VQPVRLDQSGSRRCIPQGTLKAASGLGVVVGALAASSIGSCNRQPSKSDVVHDQTRLGQHEIVAITCVVVRVSSGHVQQAGTVGSGEAAGGSPCGIEFSPSGCSTEVIGDCCSNANRKVLVKGVREHLLPTTGHQIIETLIN
jgi:hypothetical protein